VGVLSPSSEQPIAEEKETGRVEAFSDGVFAIAITLLVLNLHIPPVDDSPNAPALLTRLLEGWPAYLSFLLSFAAIGIMWINHHNLFRQIKRTDQAFLFLNGLLLMGITLVPFPTALLAEYLGHRDQNLAAMICSAVFTITAVFFNVLWAYASRNNRLLDRNADPRWVAGITAQYRFGPIFYFTSFVVAIFSAGASLLLQIAIAVFFAVPSLRSAPDKITN
jgi:uncharacterized membrane protein